MKAKSLGTVRERERERERYSLEEKRISLINKVNKLKKHINIRTHKTYMSFDI